MYAPQARKTGGSSTIYSKAFADHITVDHIITADAKDYGFQEEPVAHVVKDVYSKFRYVYPSKTKSGEQCYEDMLHFLGVDDEVNLVQSGLPDRYWPLASQHHAICLNITMRLDNGQIPWDLRFGSKFNGKRIPFGAKILYWAPKKQKKPERSKFAGTGIEGIFLGYHTQPGFIFNGEYLEQLSNDLDEMFPELFGPDRDVDPPPEDAIATRKGESNPASRAALLDDVPFSVKQKLKPKPTVPAQRPPYGYTWSGGCLVKKTNRSRPDAVDHLEWKGMTKQQRANSIEEHARKLREKNEVQYMEALNAAPAMPVLNSISEEHRERMKTLYNKKLHQIVDEMYALVAKVLSPKEFAASPEAQAAMDKEWKKLVDKGCWVEKKVREFESIASEAKNSNQKVHFGNVFEIGSLKGAELKQGDPNRKYKGRSAFQGNKVLDENADHALFAEMSSSPASMEAGKILDVFGSQPGYVIQQADANQAYTQARFRPCSGSGDMGGIWERHCELEGFEAVLTDVWESVFYHPTKKLLLVVYVDDFKLAGPKQNIKQGWDLISSVIDMDQPETIGRYFGCMHKEEHNIMLPKDAHPFRHVFEPENKNATPARKEDYWDIDPENLLAVRHHHYPRKRFYVPNEDDARMFPGIGPRRYTEWWDGETYFDLGGRDQLEFERAVAATRQGKPVRNKSEAKKEVKQSKFITPSQDQEEKPGAMTKPVTRVAYDMRDFLESCVDRPSKQTLCSRFENDSFAHTSIAYTNTQQVAGHGRKITASRQCVSTATDKAGSNHIAPTIPAVLKETIATIIVANDFVKVNTALADHPGSCTAMKNSAFTLGWSEVRYTMCWGKTLAWLQWQVGEHVKELRANYPDHIIDVIAWWCGNEISEQWGCIPRLAPGLAYRDPTVTTEAVARKVRRSADALAALAALAGEPDVGFVKIIGQVEASLFQLHSACDLFNDAMFAEFRSRGLQTQSSVEKLEMYDSFHASEDERNRQVFQNYLHNTLNLTKAEWLAEKLSPAIHALLVRFKHQESGEQHNPIVEETFAKWREEKERILNPKIPQKPKHRIVTDEDRLWEAPDVARAEDLSKVILTPPEDKAIRKDVPLTSAPSTSASMTWQGYVL
eukprot:s520_g17.t2